MSDAILLPSSSSDLFILINIYYADMSETNV
jgi:hypothetical protein